MQVVRCTEEGIMISCFSDAGRIAVLGFDKTIRSKVKLGSPIR